MGSRPSSALDRAKEFLGEIEQRPLDYTEGLVYDLVEQIKTLELRQRQDAREYDELQEQLKALQRIEDAAREFLTACDEYGCSDAPLDQYATLVEAVSGLPDGRESYPASEPGVREASNTPSVRS